LGAFVDRELREALAERARLEDRSVSSLVRAALQHFLQELASTARRETMIQESRATRAGIGDFKKIETMV
jgi:hypothetical protein